MDTNLVQSLINIMECQLEEAFTATAIAAAGGLDNLKRKISSAEGTDEAGSEVLDPKVCTASLLLVVLGRTSNAVTNGRGLSGLQEALSLRPSFRIPGITTRPIRSPSCATEIVWINVQCFFQTIARELNTVALHIMTRVAVSLCERLSLRAPGTSSVASCSA